MSNYRRSSKKPKGYFWLPDRKFSHVVLAAIIALPITVFITGWYALCVSTQGCLAAGLPHFVSATRDGGTGADSILAMARSSDGYTYVAGTYLDGAVIGGVTLSGHATISNFFVVKENSAGVALWVRTAVSDGTNSSGIRPLSMTLDTQGNVYVSGNVSGSTTFEGVPASSLGSADALLVKYASDGTFQWVRTGGSITHGDVGRSITVDPNGNAYMVGECGGGAAGSVFGGTTIYQNGNTGYDWCLAKYDSSGTLLLAKDLGGISGGFDSPTEIRTDGTALYVTGYIDNGTATFDGIPVVSAGGSDIVLAKFDTSGTLQWIQGAGGTGTDQGQRLSLTGDSLYLSGIFGATFSYGADTLTNAGGNDILFAKYDTSGNLIWARSLGGTGSESTGASLADSNGAYVAGSFNGTSTFTGGTSLTSIGAADSFLAHYNSAGTLLWSMSAGGTGAEGAPRCVLDNGVWCASTFSGTSLYGPFSLTSAGSTDNVIFHVSEVFGAIKTLVTLVPNVQFSMVIAPAAFPKGAVYEVWSPDGITLEQVNVTDWTCGDIAYLSGDTNKDGLLQAQELWMYACSSRFPGFGTSTALASAELNGLVVVQTPNEGVDTPPPILSNASAASITQNSAMITWKTDGSADSLVRFGQTANLGETTSDVALNLEHAVPVTGLIPNTAYHYAVCSRDPFGNQACSDALTFTTLPATAFIPTYDAVEALHTSSTINVDKTLVALPTNIPPCVSGTLVKLKNDGNQATQFDSTVYYCGADGNRYAFPDTGTYFSWYPDFSNVTIVSAAELAATPLVGNVTYRPGRRMVKVQSDPKVYVVEKGGVLRWVTDEAVARSLYGLDWNHLINDVSDAFFADYTLGAPINLSEIVPATSTP